MKKFGRLLVETELGGLEVVVDGKSGFWSELPALGLLAEVVRGVVVFEELGDDLPGLFEGDFLFGKDGEFGKFGDFVGGEGKLVDERKEVENKVEVVLLGLEVCLKGGIRLSHEVYFSIS